MLSTGGVIPFFSSSRFFSGFRDTATWIAWDGAWLVAARCGISVRIAINRLALKPASIR